MAEVAVGGNEVKKWEAKGENGSKRKGSEVK